ncbi:hypothetical protein HOY82DRAFT_624884 [Tuber indicum]|nr:hypothetical protein HOY82DRAFT_624884 [Tuber indicum]
MGSSDSHLQGPAVIYRARQSVPGSGLDRRQDARPDWTVGNTGFEATHIFRLKCECLWIGYGYSDWITNMEDVTGSTKINSIQNGFLLDRSINELFNQYRISADLDDGYKVVDFDVNAWGLTVEFLIQYAEIPMIPFCVRPTAKVAFPSINTGEYARGR